MGLVPRKTLISVVFIASASLFYLTTAHAAETYYEWKVDNFTINKPIGGRTGDVQRGRKITIAKNKGNCLACHSMPIPETEFHGNIGPSLHNIASRMTEGEIRLRLVDEQTINPQTIMPGFYKNPAQITQVLDEYEGKTLLTAQEIEDVVAYLMTLK